MKKTIFLLLLFACTQPSFCRDAGTQPGTPRFYLGGITKVFGSWTIHAKCLDPDYAKQMEDNPHFVTYQWGIKTGDKPIEWTESDSSAIKVNTLKQTGEYDHLTVYLKTKDASGNESNPVFVNVYDSGVINLLIKTFVVNSKGEVFEDNGSEILYDYEEFLYEYKDNYPSTHISLGGVIVTNDIHEERTLIWDGPGYIKDVLPPEEIERIKLMPDNTVSLYTLTLLNYKNEIIQKTPITVMYKSNYPN